MSDIPFCTEDKYFIFFGNYSSYWFRYGFEGALSQNLLDIFMALSVSKTQSFTKPKIRNEHNQTFRYTFWMLESILLYHIQRD